MKKDMQMMDDVSEEETYQSKIPRVMNSKYIKYYLQGQEHLQDELKMKRQIFPIAGVLHCAAILK